MYASIAFIILTDYPDKATINLFEPYRYIDFHPAALRDVSFYCVLCDAACPDVGRVVPFQGCHMRMVN
jgi:hypothetical protein